MTPDRARRAFVLLIVSCVGAAACDSPTRPKEVFGLSPSEPTLFVGSSVRADVTQTETGAAIPGRISWSSSNEAVARVDSTGLITGLSEGTAMIRATGDDEYGETVVSVAKGGGTLETSFRTTCGVSASDAAMYCWGLNSRGQTGIGNFTTPQLLPAKVNGGLSFTSATVGLEQTCGMTSTGPYCWGMFAGNQVSNGTPVADPLSPVKVKGGEAFTTIETNGSLYEPATFCSDGICGGTTCGMTPDGTALCWPALYHSPTSLVPTAVTGAPKLKILSLGMAHACGIDFDQNLWCWGYNQMGQAGTVGAAITPQRPAPDLKFQAVTTGHGHSCAIEVSGDAYCWGSNSSGQLGAPSTETCPMRWFSFTCRSTPARVNGGFKFIAISAGSATPVTTGEIPPDSHTCAITLDQSIMCWGSNSKGQLGDGTTTNRATPVKVATTLKFRSVTTGLEHTCAIATDGRGYCWGGNSSGELGTGTTTSASVPTAVSGNLAFK